MSRLKQLINAEEARDATGDFPLGKFSAGSFRASERAAQSAEVTPILERGVVRFLDIKCACGERILIELEY